MGWRIVSITILTGAPGHGKSYTSIKMIDEFVHKGKSVGTNVALARDFPYQMARRHVLFGAVRKKAVHRRMEIYSSRIYICNDIKELTRIRFDGKGEGRGKIVVEEAHRHMNVRGGKGNEAKERKEIVEYASGHRHYGADVVLITQAIGNIDLHIRNLYEFHAEVRDLRKHPVIGLIIRLIPGGHMFIRRTTWNDRAKTKAGLSMYFLSKRLANLYDTHSLEETDWPDDAIILPIGSQHRRSLVIDSSPSPSSLTPGERRRLRKKQIRAGRSIPRPRARSGRPREVLLWISQVEASIK